jgi:hypothetical protein
MTPHVAVNLPCPKAVMLAIMLYSLQMTDSRSFAPSALRAGMLQLTEAALYK